MNLVSTVKSFQPNQGLSGIYHDSAGVEHDTRYSWNCWSLAEKANEAHFGFGGSTTFCEDENGDILVADPYEKAIRRISVHTKHVSAIVGGHKRNAEPGSGVTSEPDSDSESWIGHPTGILVDSSGRLVIEDGGSHLLLELSADGSLRTLAGQETVRPPSPN